MTSHALVYQGNLVKVSRANMPPCAVLKCKNTVEKVKKKDGISYYRFPREEPRREKWRLVIATNRHDEYFKPSDSTVVCSDHFLETDFFYTPKGYRRLKKDAYPRVKLSDDDGPTEAKRKRRMCEQPTDWDAASGSNSNSQLQYSALRAAPIGFQIETLDNTKLNQGHNQFDENSYCEINETRTDKPVLDNFGVRNQVIGGKVTDCDQNDLLPATNHRNRDCEMNETETHTDKPIKDDVCEITQVTSGNVTDCNENDFLPATSHDNMVSTGSDLHEGQDSVSGISSVLNSPKTAIYKKEMNKFHRRLLMKDKQIRNLRSKNKRLVKANKTLKDTLLELKNKRLVDESLYGDLQKINEDDEGNIMKILSANKKQKFATYPPALRKFALTLHFYSPAAYQYLRRVFNKSLPHPSTLFRWYKDVSAKPGFTEEAMNRLAEKSKESTKPLLCSLIADEMSIREQKLWTGVKYEGLVDLGIGTDDAENKANQALVFLLVSLDQSWSLPISYFFIQSLTGEMKANLINIALQKCHEVGVKVVSVTFDGCKSNINCMKVLGCNLDDRDNLKTTFKHPSAEHDVAILLDACHMVKLLRNLLESKKEISTSKSDNLIKWNHVEELHNLQQETCLNLGNKLTHKHIHFRNEIMKVKLATQLLSNSVANAIEFCDKELKIPTLNNSDETVKFLKTINDIFDVLNSRKLTDYGLKKPINQSNAPKIFELCDEAKNYLLSLKTKVSYKRTIKVNGISRKVIELKVIPLHKCRANTGLIGLLTCIASLKHLYTTLVETKTLSYLTMFKFCQDHIELFFGKVRGLGGYNNNPNTRQFATAYKKLLAHMELTSKFTGNCMPLENYPILQSGTQNINHSSHNYRHEEHNEESISQAFIAKRLTQEDTEKKYTDNCDHLSEMINSNKQPEMINQIVGYISGFVVYHLLKKIECNDCRNNLLATESKSFHKLVDIKDMGGLCYASDDVYRICSVTENTIRYYVKLSGNKTLHKKYDKSFLTVKVLQALTNVRMFDQIDAHTKEQYSHFYDLTKLITQKYVDLRLHYLCKTENMEKKSKSKRQVYNKLNLFEHN